MGVETGEPLEPLGLKQRDRHHCSEDRKADGVFDPAVDQRPDRHRGQEGHQRPGQDGDDPIVGRLGFGFGIRLGHTHLLVLGLTLEGTSDRIIYTTNN